MSQVLKSAADAAHAFVAQVGKAARRVEAKVESANGMPLLCAVEAVLRQAAPRPETAHELVWLTGAPKPGGHVLQLKAFGQDNQVLGSLVVEIEG